MRELKIGVLTHNPEKYSGVMEFIEKHKCKRWTSNLNFKVGNYVLIYISSNIRQIYYLMEVIEKINKEIISLKLIRKFTDKERESLSYEKLIEHGLKQGTVNYILNNNLKLYEYVLLVIEKEGFNKGVGKRNENRSNYMKIKNIILYGVAGVGKTHNSNQLIKLIENKKSEQEIFSTIQNNKYSENIDISDIKERVKFITFHQSFGYEDFIEGFRPDKEGKIKLIDGIFKEICQEATENREKNYYLVIDEINRGNISKIFGELITLIEEDKRDKLGVILPYSKSPFKIPSNLYIIGTMNSTDKSIALIDIALRRRFTFLNMKPNPNLIKNPTAKEIFEKLNKYIIETLGEDYQIGHSYFINIYSDNDLKFILKYKIEPLLEEYFYGDEERLKGAKKIYGENL